MVELAEERAFYAYFIGVIAVFYQSTNDKISREQDSGYKVRKVLQIFILIPSLYLFLFEIEIR